MWLEIRSCYFSHLQNYIYANYTKPVVWIGCWNYVDLSIVTLKRVNSMNLSEYKFNDLLTSHVQVEAVLCVVFSIMCFRLFREQEKILSKTKFFQLCKHEPVLHFMRKSDYQFYQNLVDVLIPDVLRPIPSEYFFLINIQMYWIYASCF